MASTSVAELSVQLPQSLDTRIYIRLSTLEKVTLVSLTTASQDEPAAAPPMGSFVYAMPNRFDSTQPLATTLFPHEQSIEFSTRLAKLLARKTSAPVYVTNSMSFANAGMGGTVEEEMEGLKSILDAVLPRIQEATSRS